MRFEEYFLYEVSSELKFADTPHGHTLPDMTFRFNPIRPKPIQRYNMSITLFLGPSAMSMCEYFTKKYENISVSIGGTNNQTINLNSDGSRCAIQYSTPFISIDIGKNIGPWNNELHKFILLSTAQGLKLDNVYHESSSILDRTNDDYSDSFEINVGNVNNLLHLNYLFVKLLESPYRTDCEPYRDPEKYIPSWYSCYMNRTSRYGRISDEILTQGYNNMKRYWDIKVFSYHPLIAMKCIADQHIKNPCQALTSQLTVLPRESGVYPGKILIEPKTMVSTIMSPKIRAIDFFIRSNRILDWD